MERGDGVDDRLADDQLYRVRGFAFGRSGLRPIVALPESLATRVVRYLNRVEVVSILLYLASTGLWAFDQTGVGVPATVGGFVILLRAVTLFLGHLVIAETVTERRTTGETPDFDVGGITEVIDGIRLRALVEEREITLIFFNNSLSPAGLRVRVTAPDGGIRVEPEQVAFDLPTHLGVVERFSKKEAEHRTTFDLDVTESADGEGHETLVIEITGSKENPDGNRSERIEREIRIPVEISNVDDVVTEVYGYDVRRD